MTKSVLAKDYNLQNPKEVAELMVERINQLGEVLFESINEDTSENKGDALSVLLGFIIGAQVVCEIENDNLARRVANLEATIASLGA